MIEKVGDGRSVFVLFFVELWEAEQTLDLQSPPVRQLLLVLRDMEVFLCDGPVRPRHSKETGKRLEERRLA